jgi:hypothetical protein
MKQATGQISWTLDVLLEKAVSLFHEFRRRVTRLFFGVRDAHHQSGVPGGSFRHDRQA